uniref:hypothetical protein n=1 Tax=Eubacterium sp. TaxID=142586 RepID=UPI003FEDF03C
MGVTGGAAPGAWAPSAAPQAEQLSALSGLLRPQFGQYIYIPPLLYIWTSARIIKYKTAHCELSIKIYYKFKYVLLILSQQIKHKLSIYILGFVNKLSICIKDRM